MELYLTRGFDDAPLSEVAARLGISKAAIYYHFQSKDEILQALVDPLLDAVDALVAESTPFSYTIEARARLLEQYSEVLRAHRAPLSLMANDAGIMVRPAIKERTAGHVKTLLAYLAGPDPTAQANMRAYVCLMIVQRGWGAPIEQGHILALVGAQNYHYWLVELAREALDVHATSPVSSTGS